MKKLKNQTKGLKSIFNSFQTIICQSHLSYFHFATNQATSFAFVLYLSLIGFNIHWTTAVSFFLREPKELVNVERGSSSKYLYVFIGKYHSFAFHVLAIFKYYHLAFKLG